MLTDPTNRDTDNDGLQDGQERGVTTPIADPDGAGPVEGTDPAYFTPDTDPATTTDPLDSDTDDGGVADGAEDRDADGTIDGGERNPTPGNGADDAAASCSVAPLWEVSGATSTPAYGVRVRKQGSDVVLTWNDELGARGEDCVVYRVYAATNVDRPTSRSQYRLLATTTTNAWTHRGAEADPNYYDYVIVAWSAGAAEGSWGYGTDADGNLFPR